ncbi:MAG TPA: prepilin-type N-terminal cleavage/methylation domain-containing protein [Polyangia bacterium]|nr:prepilin-type N-terminal cleavage/methylation domain-containing protein [Polyangia bacterium]
MVKKRRRTEEGFTLLEVLMALLIGMIGLLGTVAVQQTVLRATASANDAQIATRLATQRMEQFSVSFTYPGPPVVVDELAPRAAITGALAKWSTPEYLDASGACATGTGTWTAKCRWMREWKVTNLGVGLPYDISVRVTYNLDGATPKVVRLDMERRKTF